MNAAAERIFGFVRGATKAHTLMGLQLRSDKEQIQKTVDHFFGYVAATGLDWDQYSKLMSSKLKKIQPTQLKKFSAIVNNNINLLITGFNLKSNKVNSLLNKHSKILYKIIQKERTN